ncbi:MAG: AAA family ATPase, partial [Egibacteraceae bacterium]
MAGQRGPSGGTSEHVFVGGWRVAVGPYGVEVAEAAGASRGALLRLRPTGQVLPEPFPDLLGRQNAVEEALEALREQALVEVYGEGGIGKTSLLRNLAHRAVAAFPDLPVVYHSAAGQTLGDLLQALFVLAHRGDVRVKLADHELRRELGRSQAVLLLDDVEFGPDELAELLDALRGCRVVLTSTRRRMATQHRSIELSGLDEQAAGQLVRQALGRQPQADEPADIHQLWSLLAGHPLRLLQATGLVREDGRTFAELVGALQAGDPVEVLRRMCVGGLSDQQRRVIAVLVMAGGMLLPEKLVTAMGSVANAGAELRELRGRELVEQRRGRYSLPAGSLGQPERLLGPAVDRALALRKLVAWLEDPSTQPEDLLSASNAALKLLEFACEAGEWDSAIGLIRGVEPALVLSGRWQAWRSTLEQGLHAAQTLQQVGDQAYFLHQIGSGALALDDPRTALRVLDEAAKLRRFHNPRAAAVTRQNRDAARQHLSADGQPGPKRDWSQWVRVAGSAVTAVAVLGFTIRAAINRPELPPSTPAVTEIPAPNPEPPVVVPGPVVPQPAPLPPRPQPAPPRPQPVPV